VLENLHSLNVLLVEDEEEIQKALQETLLHFFANVYIASNGEKALSILEKKVIHAVFTDFEMPVLNGYELVKEMRKINYNIPVTIISNHDDREKLQACIPLKLYGYLFKPLRYVDIKKYLETFATKLIEEGVLMHTFSNMHSLNFIDHTLIEGGNIHHLTKLEFLFLDLLISRNGKIATTEHILEHLHRLQPSGSTIKNIVYRLKKKYNFDYIENIPHLGYKLIHDA